MENNLTDKWKNRGAKTKKDYAILTNEIYKEGFGLSAKEYKQIKRLHDSNNLRDSMTNIELALTNLGEATTVEFHKYNESIGLDELKTYVGDAGKVVKGAHIQIEDKIKSYIITTDNHFVLTNKQD